MNRTLTLTPEQQSVLRGLLIVALPEGRYQLLADNEQLHQLEKYGYLAGYYCPFPDLRGYALTDKGRQAAETLETGKE